jgi:phosphoribosylamine---glycine ligase
MRILIHSQAGDIGGIAYQMVKEGAKVDLFIKEKSYRRAMDGLVPKVETIEEGLKNKPDLVIFDLNGDGDLADKIRKDGHKVIGSSALADKLEMDRAYGGKVAKQYGLHVPKTTEFKDIKLAIAFVKQGKKPYAVKVDDNKSEASSFVAKDAEEMVDYLAHAKEEGTISSSDTFVIQEVVKGAEISTELWFSDGNPIWPANSTLETKKFLAGELGQRTGCETSLVYHYQGDASKIVDKTIRKLLPLLKYSKYTGPMDVNCIVSETDHEPYFLEFTPRIGYSAIYAFMAILGMPISEFFSRVSRGTFTIPFKSLWGSALKLSIPPYPCDIEDKKASEETYGKTEGTRINGKYGKDFIPIDVEKGEKTEFMTAGTSCIIGECLGRGKSVFEAWRASQKVFKSVEVPSSQGRYTDGIEDAWKRIWKLRQFGYTDVPAPSGGPGSGVTPSLSKGSPV